MTNWFLEGYLPDNDTRQQFVLEPLPMLIGRQTGLPLADASPNMSRYHAELAQRGERLILRDLGSRNGTFVNRERIDGEREVVAGDIVHFADAEFRLGRRDFTGDTGPDSTGIFREHNLPRRFPASPEALRRLLDEGTLTSLFQPIVVLDDDERVFAYECLTRGEQAGLPKAPGELLRVAAASGHEVDLSELMRSQGVAAADRADLHRPLFINIHPHEVGDLGRLLDHLGDLVAAHPAVPLVLELHEAAIPELYRVAELATGLRAHGIRLAYDDFGSGQARLMELVETPPDFLKFDRSLLAGIDQRPESQHRMVAMLVRYAREHGILTLAEGISRPGEARVCRELGFDYAQGYLYGEPVAPKAA